MRYNDISGTEPEIHRLQKFQKFIFGEACLNDDGLHQVAVEVFRVNWHYHGGAFRVLVYAVAATLTRGRIAGLLQGANEFANMKGGDSAHVQAGTLISTGTDRC